MWNLLTNRNQECNQVQDLLEAVASKRLEAASIEVFLDMLPTVQRAHFSECGRCREAGQTLLATRALFKGVRPNTVEAGPWFTQRVMASIAARQRELTLPVSAWTAVPRFASRLSWMTAIVLLIGSTWLFERPVNAPTKQPSTVQEYLFESPQPPMNQDDVLMSMAEKNP